MFFLPAFFYFNFLFALSNTYFDVNFYDQHVVDPLYSNSKKILISEIKRNLPIDSDFLTDDMLDSIVKDYYTQLDVKDFIHGAIDAIKSYDETSTMIISFADIKSNLQKIINAITYLDDSVSVDFYQYVPVEIDLSNVFSDKSLQTLNIFFDSPVLIKVIYAVMLFAFVVCVYFLSSSDMTNRFLITSAVMLGIFVLELVINIFVFEVLKKIFYENLPLVEINKQLYEVGVEGYAVLIKPFYFEVLRDLVVIFAIGIIFFISGIYLKYFKKI